MDSYALDSNNDMFLDANNSIKRVKDGAEVVQAVRSRLLFYLGEAPLDTSVGVPYFERIFIKPADLPATESILKQEILETEGVQELTDFGLDYNQNSRALKIVWAGISTYGTVIGATLNV